MRTENVDSCMTDNVDLEIEEEEKAEFFLLHMTRDEKEVKWIRRLHNA